MDEVIIIVPTEKEAAYLAKHGMRAHICGVGMAECAAATARLLADSMIAGRRPDLAILAGVAGAGDGYGGGGGTCTYKLEVGDAVVVESETIADLGREEKDGSFTAMFQKTYAASYLPEGFQVVRGRTVNTAGRNGLAGTKRGVVSGSDGGSEVAVENMEGAAFFAVCEQFGVRAAEVRTISNRVGEPVTTENLDIAARRLAEALAEMENTGLLRLTGSQ